MSIDMLIRAMSEENYRSLIANAAAREHILFGPRVTVAGGKISLSPNGMAALYAILWNKSITNTDALRASGWHAPDPGDIVDMDKSYQSLHPMLTGLEIGEWGGPVPLGCLNGAGSDLSGPMGPAWGLDAGQVQRLKAEIASISEETLRTRFDSKRIGELSLNQGVGRTGEEALNYAMPYFTKFKELVARSADRGMALVFMLLV